MPTRNSTLAPVWVRGIHSLALMVAAGYLDPSKPTLYSKNRDQSFHTMNDYHKALWIQAAEEAGLPADLIEHCKTAKVNTLVRQLRETWGETFKFKDGSGKERRDKLVPRMEIVKLTGVRGKLLPYWPEHYETWRELGLGLAETYRKNLTNNEE